MCFQWVVACRPSSTPAAASTKAPVQIDTTRRPRSRASASTSSTASGGRRSGSYPGTITVSAARTCSMSPSASRVKPAVVVTFLSSAHRLIS